jgi:hypothetical protein
MEDKQPKQESGQIVIIPDPIVEGRPCLVDGKPAEFRCYSTKAYTIGPSPCIGGYPGGQVSFPVGVVEYPDGRVGWADITLIRFIDRGNEHDNG